MSVDLLQPPTDEAVAKAASRFAEIVRARYGTALRGVFIFGSRARGGSRPFSDVDLAIVVDDAVDTSRETFPLSGHAYDVLVETGAEVQPWCSMPTSGSIPSGHRRPLSCDLRRKTHGRCGWRDDDHWEAVAKSGRGNHP
jgi:antitoxin ChpS